MTPLLNNVQNAMQLRFVRETSEEASICITTEQKQKLVEFFCLANQSIKSQNVKMPVGTSIEIRTPIEESNDSSSSFSVNKSLYFFIPVGEGYMKSTSIVLSIQEIKKVQALFQGQIDKEESIITVPEGTYLKI